MKQKKSLESLTKKKKVSETNVATRRIIGFLTFDVGALAWRNNVLPIPLAGGGFRPGSKKGVTDVLAILPPVGRMLGVELKKGKDRLRPEQEGFHTQARKLGAMIIVAIGNDNEEMFNSFLEQFKSYGK